MGYDDRSSGHGVSVPFRVCPGNGKYREGEVHTWMHHKPQMLPPSVCISNPQ